MCLLGKQKTAGTEELPAGIELDLRPSQFSASRLRTQLLYATPQVIKSFVIKLHKRQMMFWY